MHVEATVVGRAGAAIEPRPVGFAPPEAVVLRDLIAHLVRDEVKGYNRREHQRRLVRVLTPDEIEQGAAVGKVDQGGRETTGPANADAAVEAALQAFEDGLYFVFVDNVQVEDLLAPVTLREDTLVRFVRLMPLAGGC